MLRAAAGKADQHDVALGDTSSAIGQVSASSTLFQWSMSRKGTARR
jgi:hypothetical protein